MPILLLLLLFALPNLCSSQPTSSYIIPDRLIYHDKDIINFKAILFRPAEDRETHTIEISIFDHQSNVLLSKVFETNNLIFSGSINLPTEFPSGKYYLAAYNSNSNPILLPQVAIYLIDLKATKTDLTRKFYNTKDSKIIKSHESNNLNVAIQSSKLLHLYLPKLKIPYTSAGEDFYVNLIRNGIPDTTFQYIKNSNDYIPVKLSPLETSYVEILIKTKTDSILYSAIINDVKMTQGRALLVNNSTNQTDSTLHYFNQLIEKFKQGTDVIFINNSIITLFLISSTQQQGEKIKSRKDLVGKVYNLSNPSDVSNKIVTITSQGETSYFGYTLTDEYGDFYLEKLRLYGKNKLLIQVIDPMNNYEIEVLHPSKPSPVKNIFPEPVLDSLLIIDSAAVKYLIIHKNFSELPTTEDILIEINSSKKYNPSDYLEFENTLDFIRNAIPLKKLSISKNDTSIFLLNHETKKFYKQQPLFIIDGMITYSFKEICEIPLSEIMSMDILLNDNKAIQQYGRLANFGVLFVTTKKNLIRNKSNILIFPWNGIIRVTE